MIAGGRTHFEAHGHCDALFFIATAERSLLVTLRVMHYRDSPTS